MALPVVNAPVYTLEVPSTKKVIKFRPFLVKEEKLLLIAMQDDKKESAIVETLKQIVKNCTFGEVDVESLSITDIEYIFLQLRAKSKGDEVEVSFKCSNDVNGESCDTVNQTKINLQNVKVEKNVDHSNKIMLTDTIGIILKEPTLNDIATLQEKIGNEYSDMKDIFESINGFIDTIFNGEVIYNEYTKEELTEFIESLSDEQFQKIKSFFETMTKLKLDVNITCKKCGYNETVTLEGLQSFLV